VYSGAVSSHSLKPSMSIRQWGIVIAVVCTVLALFLPMHSLEPFLLLLSSVFVPLYGVILGRLGTGIFSGQGTAPAADEKVKITAAALWIAGIVVYHALAKWAPQFGSALPTLVFTFVLAWLSRPKQA
jgi:nucleobase:cation symporter-1, NCS1 family